MTDEQIAIYEYRVRLASHDMYYAYSDDNSVYLKGKRDYQEISALQKMLDADKSIWAEYFN